MDSILSEFVAHTSADPGLATDLLDAHDWNLHSALSAYYVMKGILPGEVPLSDQETATTKTLPSMYPKHACENTRIENCSKSRPPLQKMPAIDLDDGKKLSRGISRATDNHNIVTQARKELADDFDSSHSSKSSSLRLETPDHTFSLPDLSAFPEGLREYLQKDLIETATLVSLEQAGRLNWWYTRKIGKKLWPLSTTGDGNCLLHAASLGMWGFHDRLLTLRKALHSLLTNSSYTDAFYRRWRWQTTLQNKEAGLIFCEEEWEKEWKSLLKLSSSEPRQSSMQRNSSEHLSSSSYGCLSSDGQSEIYESLEELHVLGLAHVLKRPIIVIADTVLKDVTGEPFAPIPFGGIYLPLECSPSDCHRSPLCLTYDSAHFSALVPMDEEGDESSKELRAVIPVTDPDNKLLPLQFAIDPGNDVRWGQDEEDPWVRARLTLTDKEKLIFLNEYLDIRTMEVNFQELPAVENSPIEMNGHLANAKTYDPYESDDSLPEGGISCTGGKTGKSQAARKLHTVAKQFGSIGRSMSKKLKNMARRGGSFKGEHSSKSMSDNLKNKRTLSGLPLLSRTATVDACLNPRQVVVAVLYTEKKHEYHNKLIENYIVSAINRYESDKMSKNISSSDGCNKFTSLQCVNAGCTMFGSPSTSYLCSACFAKHKEEEYAFNGRKPSDKSSDVFADEPVYVSGKSTFYTESGITNKSVEKLPVVSHVTNGLSDCKNSLFHSKYHYNNDEVFSPKVLPEFKGDLVIIDSRSLKTIQESASS